MTHQGRQPQTKGSPHRPDLGPLFTLPWGGIDLLDTPSGFPGHHQPPTAPPGGTGLRDHEVPLWPGRLRAQQRNHEVGALRGPQETSLETRPPHPHPKTQALSSRSLKPSSFVYLYLQHEIEARHKHTHTHASPREGAGTRSLGSWAGAQTLRHWRGTPAGPPPHPCPRVCGRRRGLFSVSGPRGNVTVGAPGLESRPPEPLGEVQDPLAPGPGKVQGLGRGSGQRHSPPRASQVDLS